MQHVHFSMASDGFAGHLAEPDGGSDRAVIVVMGGEQSILPAVKFAERFADFGITGLAVSLFGAEGLPASPDRIPLEIFGAALRYLREQKHIPHISIYGQSMGTVFAMLAAQHYGGMEKMILVSPTHVPFEGTLPDRKTMSGHSVATWHGAEIPFVRPDFSRYPSRKYQTHPAAVHKVTGMWAAFSDAYADAGAVEKAMLNPAASGAEILMIAGMEDECWDADGSVQKLLQTLKAQHYPKHVRVLRYRHGSHLNGLMPNRTREKRLYRLAPLIGLFYRTFGRYRKENMAYFARAEREIIDWIRR